MKTRTLKLSKTSPSQSLRVPLLFLLSWLTSTPSFQATDIRPYFQRPHRNTFKESDFESDTLHIDFRNALIPTNSNDPVEEANKLRDKRTAAAVRNRFGANLPFEYWSENSLPNQNLLEQRIFEDPPLTLYTPTSRCLAFLAYQDFFANTVFGGLEGIVNSALLRSQPGYAGTFGPGVDGTFDILGDFPEGNYDMTQMRLLPIAYQYFDRLSPDAREHLIIKLLAQGIIHRPRVDDVLTHGVVPEDWSRAGFVSPAGYKVRIGETENHILMIMTVRYLVNQLLYQRNPHPDYDNRNNAHRDTPSCTSLLLTLLQRMLQADFSEYNAKNYQSETRMALLNLCSYAYDHEVRLAARMVLDYVSAKIAVSSSDLRRMPPFRRRNESNFIAQLPGGFMDVGLLDWTVRADPMTEYFAIASGQLRAFSTPNPRLIPGDPKNQIRPWIHSIASDGVEGMMEGLSSYRLPPSIHDLFLNDSSRRFFQRLHRTPLDGVGSHRNADNMEIYAGSPSYLITAGGQPAPYAIDPDSILVQLFGYDDLAEQLGVALPTSFMPAGLSAGPFTQNNASDLIQFSQFSDGLRVVKNGDVVRDSPHVANYGVAPDFACGHKVYLPPWVTQSAEQDGRFLFVNKRSPSPNSPGFYLAILRDGEFASLEAWDTLLHPELSFPEFKQRVKNRNGNVRLLSNVETSYTTQNGNTLRLVIWNNREREGIPFGARILSIQYGSLDPNDRLGDAGNTTDRFLNGTILNSPRPAVVEISNPRLGTRIVLDMSDPWNPTRTDEQGRIEHANATSEIWVDFEWKGTSDGTFFHPFKTLGDGINAVNPGGTIKITPGRTAEKTPPAPHKPFRIEAPLGGVFFGNP